MYGTPNGQPARRSHEWVDVAPLDGLIELETPQPADDVEPPAKLSEPVDADQADQADQRGQADQGGRDDSRSRPDAGEAEVDLDLLEEIASGLSEVQAALDRLDAGTYGLCEHCGEVIDEDVLEENPTARFCGAHLPFVSGDGDIGTQSEQLSDQ